MQYWDKRYARNLAQYGLAVMSVLRTVVNRGEKPTQNTPHSPLEMPYDQGKHKSLGKNLTVGFASCHNGFTRQGKSPSH